MRPRPPVKYFLVMLTALLLMPLASAQTLVNPTPPMGWNSWYQFGCNINETIVKAQADAMVSLGLKALGYQYVNIDDCWDQRVGSVISAIPSKFPDGMAAVGTYIHNDGLKFGLYGSPGTLTCSNYPGQYGYESSDAATLASWGVDYWKYDWCSGTASYGTTPSAVEGANALMVTDIAATGRPMSFLVNDYGEYNSPNWFQAIGANIVRIGTDVGITGIDGQGFGINYAAYLPYQNKGHWMDPDMILAGNSSGAWSTSNAICTGVLCRTQFNHWSILAAPLLLAADLTAIGAYDLATVSNPEVIAVDQDSLGVMGYRVSQVACGSTYCEVWVRKLSSGWAVELVNRDTAAAHNVAVNWSMFGLAGPFSVRDLWAHSNLGSYATGYTGAAIPASGSMLLLLTGDMTAQQNMSVQGLRVQ